MAKIQRFLVKKKAAFYLSWCFYYYFLFWPLHLKSVCINEQQRQQKGEHIPPCSTSKYTHLGKKKEKKNCLHPEQHSSSIKVAFK